MGSYHSWMIPHCILLKQRSLCSLVGHQCLVLQGCFETDKHRFLGIFVKTDLELLQMLISVHNSLATCHIWVRRNAWRPEWSNWFCGRWERVDQQRRECSWQAQLHFAGFNSTHGHELLHVVSTSVYIMNPTTSTLRRWSKTNGLRANAPKQ